MGRQLCYLIGSDHGWLGGLGFGSAALYLQGREDWVGWNHCQRGEHLERVIKYEPFLDSSQCALRQFGIPDSGTLLRRGGHEL